MPIRTILFIAAGFFPLAVGAIDLLQVYDLATQSDPKLLEAEANRNAVLETQAQSLAKLLPTLAITGSLNQSRFDTNRTYTSLQLGMQNFWDSSVYLKLTQPIYHHDYWVQLSQADNQAAQAEAEYGAEQQELFTRSAKAYLAVLAAQDGLEYAEAEKRAMQQQLDQAHAKFFTGTLANADYREAQAALDLAVAAVISAERSQSVAQAALREITGVSEPALARLGPNLPLLPPDPNVLREWSELAQNNNLSILAAENKLEFASKNRELQFAGHLPTLDVVGSVGTTDTDRPAGLVSNSQVVGLQLNVPLYQGGIVDSRERQAEHQYSAAKQNLEKNRRSVEKQIQEAFYGIRYAIQQAAAQKTAVESGRAAVEAAQAAYRHGTGLMVDVITAERNFYKAQRDYLQARYDYVYNSLYLKQAASMLGRQDVEIANIWFDNEPMGISAQP